LRDIRDELIAAARHGQNESMVLGVLTECAAKHVNRLREVALFDHDIGPDGREQGLFFDDLAGMLYQEHERSYGLRCQVDRLVTAQGAKDATPHVEPKLAELIEELRFEFFHIPAPEI
jgi:hypothetical protein